MRKRTGKKIIAILLMLALLGGMENSVSKAYFQRGPVGIALGQSSVVLQQGGSASVSVSFSPAQSTQLPGCGMAECPQICGEKDCLDANGECKCAGTTYQTYYAFASVASSNTSVATASYGNGVIYVNAISPGTAYITATASLRQFTSTSATMTVTVNAKPQTEQNTTPANPPSGGSSAGGSTGGSSAGGSTAGGSTSTGGSASTGGNTSSSGSSTSSGNTSSKGQATDSVKVESVKEKKTETEKTDTKEKETEKKTVGSDRGKITFVQIPDGKTGKEELKSILGKKEYVDFQKKDKSETILYAWEFCGTDLKEARDLNLNIEISEKPFDGCEYGSSSTSIYLKRMEEEALPGKADTFIRVSERFDEEDSLNLYSWSDGDIKLEEEGIEIENGYATCAMYGEETCYILTTEKWDVKEAENETEKDAAKEEAVEEETMEEEKMVAEEDGSQTKSIAIGSAALLLLGGYVWLKRKKDMK